VIKNESQAIQVLLATHNLFGHATVDSGKKVQF